MHDTVTAEAQLRERNQLTIPDRIAKAAGIGPGETFVVELDSDDPDALRLRRVRTTYAGSLRGLYGKADEYLERERGSWGRR